MHGCCEVGERLLKTEAKKVSRTAQQRGSTIFERQTCSRILDRHLFDKMRLALEEKQEDTTPVEQSISKKDKFSRKIPHFILHRKNAKIEASDRKGNRFPPNANTGCPSVMFMEKLLDLESELEVLELYNEVILRDGSYVRASPNYRGDGPWFDFANIQWEDDNAGSYLLPAKCVLFYKKNNECMALIHSVDTKTEGKVAGRRNSILTSHYRMQCDRNGHPVLYSINCASIDSSLLCFTRDTGNEISKESVMVVRPRNEWAYAWYVWNQYLRTKNCNRTVAKPMIDLGNEDMIVKVRKEIAKCIKEHGKM
jgi:hypothetical protein